MKKPRGKRTQKTLEPQGIAEEPLRCARFPAAHRVRLDPGPRRASAQSEEPRRRPATRPAGRPYGCEWFGEEFAGVRYDLRRRPAPLSRMPLKLSPASFSTSSRSPMSTRSRACRRLSRSIRKRGPPNPRSTLGTITEIYDYLRLLFARAGTPHCPKCDAPIRQSDP